jgi:hypothetical protein
MLWNAVYAAVTVNNAWEYLLAHSIDMKELIYAYLNMHRMKYEGERDDSVKDALKIPWISQSYSGKSWNGVMSSAKNRCCSMPWWKRLGMVPGKKDGASG